MTPTPPAVAVKPWGLLLLALAAFILLPLIPLPVPIRPAVPIAATLLLIVPALATCALIGWWRGGNIMVAIVWTALAVWMFVSSVSPVPGYDALAKGWVVMLVAAFGVASLLAPDGPFFARAMGAVGMAMAAAFTIAIVSPGGTDHVTDVALTEYSRRADTIVTMLEQGTQLPDWQAMIRRYPQMATGLQETEAQLRALPAQAAAIMPALLVLESLAGLALAWSIYERSSPRPAGPSLGKIRDFRFNDQLIWGLAVGATTYFLPPFAEGRIAGLNLLVFFGTLYLLRGIGVLSWVARRRGVATMLIVLTAFVPGLVGLLALGVGVGDTWMDWRGRVQSAT